MVGSPGVFAPSTVAERILFHVAARPGAWGMDISRNANVAQKVVSTTMPLLEEAGHVIARKTAREVYYFPRYNDWEMEFLPVLMSDEGFAFLTHVAFRPGVDNQAEIRQKIKISVNALMAYAQRLLDLKVVARVAIPSARKPGIGYEVPWNHVTPPLGLLAVKLPSSSPERKRVLKLLDLQPNDNIKTPS